MTSPSGNPLKILAIRLVTGILSGFLTAEAARFLDPLNPLVGIVFGIALTLLIWFELRNCTIWFAFALISSSVTSYLAAVWGTLAITGLAGRFLRPESGVTDPWGGCSFAVAGFLGALIINVALLLLLSPTKDLRLLGKGAAWAFAGGFFGFLASFFSDALGSMVAHAVGAPAGTESSYYLSLYSAYLVWQPGMFLVTSLMLPLRALSGTDQPVSQTRSPAKSSIFGKVFFCSIFATLLFLGYFVARNRYRTWNVQHQSEKLLRETPSVDNLPAIAPKPVEQVLILHEIAGYVDTAATVKTLPAHMVYIGIKGVPQHLAERIVYSVGYQSANGSSGPLDPMKASAIVSEFPNTAWANFQLKDGPAVDNGSYLYIDGTKTTRFGHPVISYSSRQNFWAFWPSANKVIVIFYQGEQAGEIVKQYLAKYPSSL